MAEYKVGTVDLVNGSAVVTGAGTRWLTAIPPVQAGQMIVLGGIYYTVAGVASDTQLQLTAPYGGSTAANLAYSVVRDYTPGLGIPIPQGTTIHLSLLLQRAFTIIESAIMTGGVTLLSMSPDLGEITEVSPFWGDNGIVVDLMHGTGTLDLGELL